MTSSHFGDEGREETKHILIPAVGLAGEEAEARAEAGAVDVFEEGEEAETELEADKKSRKKKKKQKAKQKAKQQAQQKEVKQKRETAAQDAEGAARARRSGIPPLTFCRQNDCSE